jgi:endonuclease-3 related protein
MNRNFKFVPYENGCTMNVTGIHRLETGKTGELREIYGLLYHAYGPQGWWPLAGRAGTTGHDSGGYHKGDYRLPRLRRDKFEIMAGALLTQNTAWTNVSKALEKLRRAGLVLPERILDFDETKLAQLIRSSGYYNQKARKLKSLSAACDSHNWLSGRKPPGRKELLTVWGVGEETADSILLYVFGVCIFVVDAYTKRLLLRLGLIAPRAGYGHVQSLFHAQLEKRYELYNEYHALIVEHAKQHCRTNPVCEGCVLARICAYASEKRCPYAAANVRRLSRKTAAADGRK